MVAIQSQRYCRSLLGKKRASKFEEGPSSDYINPPKLDVEITPALYDQLQTIKRERMKKESRTKRFIYTAISAVVGFIIYGFLYFGERS